MLLSGRRRAEQSAEESRCFRGLYFRHCICNWINTVDTLFHVLLCGVGCSNITLDSAG